MTHSMEDVRNRPAQTPRMSVATSARTPTTDIRKRMDDVYMEMQQNANAGQLRLPLKFLGFHETDVMFQFTRAAVGYALAYVRVKSVEKDLAEHSHMEELAKFHASQNHHSQRIEVDLAHNHQNQQQSDQEAWNQRLTHAVELQASCIKSLSESYGRLVLHCSNYEHHKEDERFFECVYFFVCSVVKIGLAPEHWAAVEDELGFLFRGAQFNATIKLHTAAKTQARQPTTALVTTTTSASNDTTNNGSSASKKIQSLSISGAPPKDTTLTLKDKTPFELPPPTTSRCCYFSASLPVSKIVAELDNVKQRAAHNMGISQSIREGIQSARVEDHKRRQLDALTSPRVSPRLDALQHTALTPRKPQDGTVPLLLQSPPTTPPNGPRRRFHAGSGSPRLSMKATFTSRSPAVNHLLPGTEDRVRLLLENYEQEFQLKLAEAAKRQATQVSSPSRSDLSQSTASIPSVHTPRKPPPR